MTFVRPTAVPAVTRSIYTTSEHLTDIGSKSIEPRFVQLAGPSFAPAPKFRNTKRKTIPSAWTMKAKVVTPQAVLAATKPGWPAPASVPSMIVTQSAPAPIQIERSKADTVIGSSIFGGAVTAGDPEIGTLHLDPYTETVAPASTAVPAAALPKPLVVPARPSSQPLDKGEGFVDVFGIQHGYAIPKARRVGMGRGAFNIQAPLSGEADGIGVGLGASMVIGYAVGLATLGLVGYGIYALAKKK